MFTLTEGSEGILDGHLASIKELRHIQDVSLSEKLQQVVITQVR